VLLARGVAAYHNTFNHIRLTMIANRRQKLGVLVATLAAAFLLLRPLWRVWYGEGADKFFVPTNHC
jgi:hypothetical protein